MTDYFVQKNWRLVQTVLSSQAAKMTLLLPTVGYVVILGDFFSPLWTFNEVTNETPLADGNWRPRWVYFGLLALVFAQCVFWLKCHSVTRRFSSAPEFANIEGNFLYRDSTVVDGVSQTKLDILRMDAGLHRLGMANQDPHGTIFSTGCAEVFEVLDKRNLVSANLTWGLIIIGLGLLAVPSINVFWLVLRSTIPLLNGSS